jgi:signal transduction histidine kinase/CheY-like chemotaxis protein
MHSLEDRLAPVAQAGHGAEPVERVMIARALAQFVGDALPALATGLGLLYLLFSVAHFLLLPAPLRFIMATIAALTALFLLGLAAYLRRHPIVNHHAHFWAALLGTLVLINSWLHLWFTRDPLQSTNLMLLIVGIGFFYLSSRWFLGFLAAVFLCCIGTFWELGVPVAESTHFAFGLLSASILSTLAHLARKRTLMRLTLLRLRDTKRAEDLQQALEAEQEVEAALRQSETGYRQLSIRLEEQAEALRLANDELAQAATLKDEFLANMSHELRTPLTAILGLTESLRENIYGSLTERQHTVIQNVHESGRHLLDLINDILDVAKTEAGKLELELLPADARMVAEVSLRFCQPAAERKQIALSADYDQRVTLFLADERRLKQILVNLLSNAVKFTAEGGRVRLRLEGDVEDEIVRYSVRDTGIGVAPEQMMRLFKPFIQLDSRLARRYSGSGLGLVLVYRMVEMHGGSVTLQSSPGQGSEFTVALPWRKVTLPTAPIAEPFATPAYDGERQMQGTDWRPSLLVVDDQNTTYSWIAALAAAEGYDALPASNPADALRLAGEMQPRLIFVDLQLGAADSLALIRTLVNHAGLNRLPVIALSALVLPQEAEQAKAAGALHYFAKPIGRKALHMLLNTYVIPAQPHTN